MREILVFGPLYLAIIIHLGFFSTGASIIKKP